MNGAGRVSIRGEIRTLEISAKGGNTGKGLRHKTLGQTSECDEVVVLRGTHHDCTGIDDDGANS